MGRASTIMAYLAVLVVAGVAMMAMLAIAGPAGQGLTAQKAESAHAAMGVDAAARSSAGQAIQNGQRATRQIQTRRRLDNHIQEAHGEAGEESYRKVKFCDQPRVYLCPATQNHPASWAIACPYTLDKVTPLGTVTKTYYAVCFVSTSARVVLTCYPMSNLNKLDRCGLPLDNPPMFIFE